MHKQMTTALGKKIHYIVGTNVKLKKNNHRNWEGLLS